MHIRSEQSCLPRAPGEGVRPITFTVPASIYKKVVEDSRGRGLSVSEFMRQLIAEAGTCHDTRTQE